MKTEKNIDNLFNEKLGEFEVMPDAKIWGAIEKELDIKEERRKLPFFWLFGSVASIALLISVFTLINIRTQQSNTIQNDVVITENPINKNENPVVVDFDKSKVNTIKLSSIDEVHKVTVSKKIKSVFNSSSKKKIEKTNSHTIYKETQLVSNDVVNIKKQSNPLIVKKNTKNIINSENRIAQKTKKHIKKEVQKNNENELANLESIAEEFKIIEKKHSKWFVQPTIGALSSESRGEIGGDVVAYGVKVGMQLNDRWSIQSGICSQEMNPKINFAVVGGNPIYSDSPIKIDLDDSGNNKNSGNNTKVERFSYIEVPLEVRYKMLKINRFSTDLLLGSSSYFLRQNTSSYALKGLEVERNYKNVNFSANLGVDFNYQIYKSLKVHLNPIFKKTLGASDRNFNGYQIGYYTGVKYDF